jgi:hypothetical protein
MHTKMGPIDAGQACGQAQWWSHKHYWRFVNFFRNNGQQPHDVGPQPSAHKRMGSVRTDTKAAVEPSLPSFQNSKMLCKRRLGNRRWDQRPPSTGHLCALAT